MPPGRRSDAVTCSTACRQAGHRFRVAPAGATASVPMTFGYADPPYPGCARKYYGQGEVDHVALVADLVRRFPHGWALSTSSAALREVLLLCPADVRVAAWVRGLRPGASRWARDAWEPVILRGGRAYRDAPAGLANALVSSRNARARSHPGALVGMKTAAFAEWLFRMMGARHGDHLADLYPGSGAVTRAWRLYAVPAAARPSGLPSRYAGDARRVV